MLLYLPTRLFWVYTIILISNTGNLHVYSERTVIRNTRVLLFFEKIFYENNMIPRGIKYLLLSTWVRFPLMTQLVYSLILPVKSVKF